MDCQQLFFQKSYFLLILLLNSTLISLASARWATCAEFETKQTILNRKFDFVETFDELKEWAANAGSFTGNAVGINKEDNSPSRWSYYTADKTATAPWIADFGGDIGETRIGSTGKALRMNYNNFVSEPLGHGPSRLGLYLGDGNAQSGYKKVYVFMRIKFFPGFFAKTSDNTAYESVGTFKFFEVSSGFTSVESWGSAEDRSIACDNAQVRSAYGLNYTIFNINGGGSSYPNSLHIVENGRTPIWKEDKQCYDYNYTTTKKHTTIDITQQYEKNEWIGIEFMLDIGTIGNNDGKIEIWLYNEGGKVIGHSLYENYNKLLQFNHLYNRMVIGGNRFGAGYSEDPGDSDENRFLIDDFIIDDDRIGIKYYTPDIATMKYK